MVAVLEEAELERAGLAGGITVVVVDVVDAGTVVDGVGVWSGVC